MTNEEIMAVVKPAICNQLKSPASAQFPTDSITISGDDAIGYTVNGFVDSQNSYGAIIRNDIHATVSVVNGKAVVTSSSVGTNTAKANAKSFAVNYVALSIIIGILAILGTIILDFIVKALY